MAQWWTAFKDPLLDSLVERAVKSNLDLRIAEARVREERAFAGRDCFGSSGQRWTLRAPTAGTALAKMRLGFRCGKALSAVAGRAAIWNRISFRTGFDADWEIDIFGGTRRRIEAAQASFAASVEDRRSVLVTLLGDVAKNYIDLRGLQRRLAVAQDNLRRSRIPWS